MVWGLDWLLVRDRHEGDEQARNRAREAQEHPLAFSGREAPAKEREAPQRAENEPRPGERMMPHHADRLRDAHDHPPEPKPVEIEREATRLELTRTAQPAPSMGGAGVTFTNSRVQQPARRDFVDELLAQAREQIAADEARELERQRSMTPQELEQEQAIERDLSRSRENERGGRTRWN